MELTFDPLTFSQPSWVFSVPHGTLYLAQTVDTSKRDLFSPCGRKCWITVAKPCFPVPGSILPLTSTYMNTILGSYWLIFLKDFPPFSFEHMLLFSVCMCVICHNSKSPFQSGNTHLLFIILFISLFWKRAYWFGSPWCKALVRMSPGMGEKLLPFAPKLLAAQLRALPLPFCMSENSFHGSAMCTTELQFEMQTPTLRATSGSLWSSRKQRQSCVLFPLTIKTSD